jgi:chromosome partitioning protein
MKTLQPQSRSRGRASEAIHLSSPFRPTPSNPLIIAVANLKGGVAKTTTAVHIAEYLRQLGTTVLVDGDPNRSALAWAGRNERPDSDSLQVITEMQVARYAQKACCYVFDTKARPEPDDLRAMIETATLILLPTPPSGDDLRVTAELSDSLKQAGSRIHRVLLTRVPDRGRATALLEARRFFELENIPIFSSYIRQYEVYKHAFVQGLPVNAVKNAKTKEAWSDYEALMKELLADVALGGAE